MTQVAEIVEKAFFEAGLTTELQHATPTQMANAVDTLAGVVLFLYGTSVGEQLRPWLLGNFGRATQMQRALPSNILQYPPPNVRLIAVNEAALTLNLPGNPSPGSLISISDPHARLATYPVTLAGNGYTIEGAASLVLSTNSANTLWLFRDDLSNWSRVTPLLAADDMPFPGEYDQMFIILMAMRLNPAYGRNISSVQAQFLKDFRQQFDARYVQSLPLQLDQSLSRMSLQSNDAWATGQFDGSNNAFNLGLPGFPYG